MGRDACARGRQSGRRPVLLPRASLCSRRRRARSAEAYPPGARQCDEPPVPSHAARLGRCCGCRAGPVAGSRARAAGRRARGRGDRDRAGGSARSAIRQSHRRGGCAAAEPALHRRRGAQDPRAERAARAPRGAQSLVLRLGHPPLPRRRLAVERRGLRRRRAGVPRRPAVPCGHRRATGARPRDRAGRASLRKRPGGNGPFADDTIWNGRPSHPRHPGRRVRRGGRARESGVAAVRRG